MKCINSLSVLSCAALLAAIAGCGGSSVASNKDGSAGTGAEAGSSRAQILSLLLAHIVPSGKGARIAALLQHGGYAVSLRAPEAGTLAIAWYLVPSGGHLTAGSGHVRPLVAIGRASCPAGRAVKVMIKLTGKGRQLLMRAKQIKLTAKASFTPTGRAAVVTLKLIALTR